MGVAGEVITVAPIVSVCCCEDLGASSPPPILMGAVLAPPGPIWPGAGFTLLPGSMLGFLK